MVSWVGLQCVVVEFPDLTHFYMEIKHLCILIHILIKVEAGRIQHVYKPFSILTNRFKACFLFGSFLYYLCFCLPLLLCLVCTCDYLLRNG